MFFCHHLLFCCFHLLTSTSLQLPVYAAAAAADPGASSSKEEEEEEGMWTAKKWLGSLGGLQGVIANALRLPDAIEEHYTYVTSLTRERMTELMMEAKLEGLVEVLVEGLDRLGGQAAKSGADLNDKFASSAKFQMSYGSLSLFYGGLEALLGPPKMLKGHQPGKEAPSLMNAMEHDHNEEKDSKSEFESSNGVTTSSVIEWEVVVCPKEELVETYGYPERAGFRETPHLREWCRQPAPLREVWGKAESAINPRLEKAGHSSLMEEEVVAGRLYTGPMYQKYNMVLRSKSQDEHLVQLCKKLCKGNSYTCAGTRAAASFKPTVQLH